MKTKNAGVTIVELVVVLAIMAIVAGLSLASIASLSGYRARECAKKISSAISANKVTALGKAVNSGSIYWELTKEGNKVYFVEHGLGAEPKKTLVGKGRMTIKYTDSSGSPEITAEITDSTNSLKLYFNRSTGQLCKQGTADRSKVSHITVSNPNGNKVYDIEVYPLTGKIKATW